jgi:hypothetical protein
MEWEFVGENTNKGTRINYWGFFVTSYNKNMAKRFLVLILFITYSVSFSQIDLVTEMVNNKYQLVKVKYKDNSNTLAEYIKAGESMQLKIPCFKMQGFVYDSTNIVQKKSIRGAKYTNKDTLLVYDWDFQCNLLPYYAVCKYKFNKKDSTLTFYKINYFDVPKKEKKVTNGIRNFKVVNVKKEEIILLDKDNTDVSRLFFLKKKDK